MNQQVPFTYLKKPWAKWCFFAAGLLQILLIFENMKQFRSLEESGIYTPAQLSEYLMQYKFIYILLLSCAMLFLGVFLISIFARSKKSAKLATSILLFAASAIYTAGIVLWGSAIPSLPLFVFFLFPMWGVFVFSLYQYSKECRKHEA